jgi:hypothetical protein
MLNGFQMILDQLARRVMLARLPSRARTEGRRARRGVTTRGRVGRCIVPTRQRTEIEE